MCFLSYLKYLCQSQDHEDTFLFSSKSIMVLNFIFKSMIHLKFICVYDVRILRIFLPPNPHKGYSSSPFNSFGTSV